MPIRYAPRIDADAITALDMHVHVESDGHGNFSLSQQLLDASAAYFKAGADRTPTLDQIAAYYRERTLAAVSLPAGFGEATGRLAPYCEDDSHAVHGRRHPLAS